MSYYPTDQELDDIVTKRAIVSQHKEQSIEDLMRSVAKAVRSRCVGELAPQPSTHHVTVHTDTGPVDGVQSQPGPIINRETGWIAVVSPHGAKTIIPLARIQRIEITKVPTHG